MLIAQERIPELSEEVPNGLHYKKRVKAMMLKELYPFMLERMIKEVGFGPAKALEIGPGPLSLGLFFAKETQWEVTGVDISEEMVELLRLSIAEEDMRGRYRARTANAEQLPYQDGSFNLVFSSGSLHHWINPVKVFEEIERVLAPGGTAIIFDLCRETFLTAEELQQTMSTVDEEFSAGLLDSLKAAYLPEEIYALLEQTATFAGWQRIHLEQYHKGVARFNQGIILRKPLTRLIRG